MLKSFRVVTGALVALVFIFGSAAVASAATANTTISSQINAVISLLSTNGTVNVNVTPTSGGVQTIASDTATVSTNDVDGYTLQLGENTGASTMVSGSNTIPASAGSVVSPVAMAVDTWGFRVDGLAGSGFGAGPTSPQSSAAISALKFAAVPASGSPVTLADTSAVATNATTTVYYGVAADTSQPSGTYTNVVTYTATTNP